MAIYEDNMQVIQKHDVNLYRSLSEENTNCDSIMIGDALDGEKFIAKAEGENIISLTSMYHPQHAAERYVEAFNHLPESTTILLFGFGDGQIVRRILSEDCPIRQCIIYEPSKDIFLTVLREYDVRDILDSPNISLIIQDLNDRNADNIIQSRVNYMNWKTFAIISLPVYNRIFPEQLQRSYEWYMNCLLSGKGSMQTVIDFAQSGLRNEIKAQRWLLNSYAVDEMVGRFPEDIPCILVANGPSLEKNVKYLHEAKGKSCIFAVDSALKYLLDQGIRPDYTCTVDAEKSAIHFQDERIKGLPVFLSTISSASMLEALDVFEPLYFMNTASYYDYLISKTGHHFLNLDVGGSVATVLFRLAIELGFRTIIIIGQDLAFTNMEFHAGRGKATEEDLMRYTLYEVEGYYGDKVWASGDFRLYIDWYARTIEQFSKNHTIINATEGGAKLAGAVQMPFQEAVMKYCTHEFDCDKVWQSLPRLWETEDARKEYYQDLKEGLRDLKNMKRLVDEAIMSSDRALKLAQRANYSESEFAQIERRIDHLLNEIESMKLYEMMLERAAETNINMADGLDEKEEDSLKMRIHLYHMIHEHMKEIGLALEEAIPMWEESLRTLEKMANGLGNL